MTNNRPWHFHPVRGVPESFHIYRGSSCLGRGEEHPKYAGIVSKHEFIPRLWIATLYLNVAKTPTMIGKGRTRNEAVCDALCKKGIPYADSKD